MEKIHVGKIVNAVALKGEVKVYTYSNPERYEEIKEIYVENKPHKIEKVRFQGNTVILKLSGRQGNIYCRKRAAGFARGYVLYT